jgi:hypothetical protein
VRSIRSPASNTPGTIQSYGSTPWLMNDTASTDGSSDGVGSSRSPASPISDTSASSSPAVAAATNSAPITCARRRNDSNRRRSTVERAVANPSVIESAITAPISAGVNPAADATSCGLTPGRHAANARCHRGS